MNADRQASKDWRDHWDNVVKIKVRGNWNRPGRRLTTRPRKDSFAEFAKRARTKILEPLGLQKWWWRKTYWDADHVRAVNDGGGECGLDNLRTLCVLCHEQRSAAQTRKRTRRGPRILPRAEGETRREYRARVLEEFCGTAKLGVSHA